MNKRTAEYFREDTIYGFDEESEYFFLSTFYPCQIQTDGYTFTSAESAYQALLLKECGLVDEESVRMYESYQPQSARKKARSLIFGNGLIIPDEVKTGIMKKVLLCKFTQNPELKDKLLATGEKNLAAYNDRNEIFFGIIYNPAASFFTGQNHLGILLEELRDEFRKNA